MYREPIINSDECLVCSTKFQWQGNLVNGLEARIHPLAKIAVVDRQVYPEGDQAYGIEVDVVCPECGATNKYRFSYARHNLFRRE